MNGKVLGLFGDVGREITTARAMRFMEKVRTAEIAEGAEGMGRSLWVKQSVGSAYLAVSKENSWNIDFTWPPDSPCPPRALWLNLPMPGWRAYRLAPHACLGHTTNPYARRLRSGQNPERIPYSSPGLRGTSYPGLIERYLINLEKVASRDDQSWPSPERNRGLFADSS